MVKPVDTPTASSEWYEDKHAHVPLAVTAWLELIRTIRAISFIVYK